MDLSKRRQKPGACRVASEKFCITRCIWYQYLFICIWEWLDLCGRFPDQSWFLREPLRRHGYQKCSSARRPSTRLHWVDNTRISPSQVPSKRVKQPKWKKRPKTYIGSLYKLDHKRALEGFIPKLTDCVPRVAGSVELAIQDCPGVQTLCPCLIHVQRHVRISCASQHRHHKRRIYNAWHHFLNLLSQDGRAQWWQGPVNWNPFEKSVTSEQEIN